MITSTTTVIPRKGKLHDIEGLRDRFIYGKLPVRSVDCTSKEVFNEDEEYEYINEGSYQCMMTQFIAIKCKDSIIMIETRNNNVIATNLIKYTKNNAEQFRIYNETHGKSGFTFEY